MEKILSAFMQAIGPVLEDKADAAKLTFNYNGYEYAVKINKKKKQQKGKL